MGIHQPMTMGLFLHPCSACRHWRKEGEEQFVCRSGKTPPDGVAQPGCYDLDDTIAQADRDVGAAILVRAQEIRAERSSYRADLVLLSHSRAVRAMLNGDTEEAGDQIETAAQLLAIPADGNSEGQLRAPSIIDTNSRGISND
jgi:hypothetical protein